MYDLFLCVEMKGLYHINQQLSELLYCILLDDELLSSGEKSANKLVFMGCWGLILVS